MNETLEQLQNDLQSALDEMKSQEAVLSDEATSGDAFKEAKERFEAADARSGELASRIREIQSTHEMTRQREDARKAMALRSEDAAKIRESLTRRPDMKASNPREVKARVEEALGSAKYAKDMVAAVASWAGYSQKNRDLSSEMLSACQRIGLNPADPELNLNRGGEFTEWFRQELAKVQVRPGMVPHAGQTDVADSRDGQFSGVLNRPPFQLQELAVNSYSTNGILAAPVKVMTTDHGDPVEETYLNDMPNVGRKIGEGQSIQGNKNPGAGKITWFANKYTSDSLSYTWEMLRKSRWELPQLVPGLLGERLGQITGSDFTNGSGGAGDAQGLITAAVLGGLISTTEVANAISVNDIRYMAGNSIDHRFFRSRTVGWMMGRETWAYLSTKKDGQGRPYYEMSKEIVNGMPVYQLEGFPVFINYDFPTVSFATGASQTGTTMLIFGDFSRFVVRYAFGSEMPILIRDDVTGIARMETNFSAVQWADSRLKNYGNAPFAVLQSA